MTQRLLSADYFETSELSLATTLLYFGHPLEAIDHGNPKSVFLFPQNKELSELVQAYWQGQLSVEPKQWFYCQREMKARLYAKERP
jgi:hypothetical protein